MDKHHILVVDDNHINRLFFASSLKKLGLTVTTVENGFKAIELCQQQKFAMILMDIRMDGLDGIQTASAIRSIKAHQTTTILAISAERFDCDQHPQFAQCLLKPISQEQLKTVIGSYLSDQRVNTVTFDEQQALQISHQDLNIVLKLRQLLVDQLIEEWHCIKKMHKQQDWQKLSERLHKILGSAKICAASLLVESVARLKSSVDKNQSDSISLQRLKQAIEKTIQAHKRQTDPD